jgi:serine O-acetyltransferase
MSPYALIKSDVARLTTPTPWRIIYYYFRHPGFRAVALYRIAHWLSVIGFRGLPELITARSLSKTGAEILCRAEIGPGLLVTHPAGVVVGSGAKLGSNCTVMQNVTIGVKSLLQAPPQYPTLGDKATLCAGAIVLGNVAIGDEATIGAGAVVITDVPRDATVCGVPARILRRVRRHDGTGPFRDSIPTKVSVKSNA